MNNQSKANSYWQSINIGQLFQDQSEPVHVDKKLINKFIDRCIEEKNYTYSSLYQDIALRISPRSPFQGMVSMGLVEIGPQILTELRHRIDAESKS